MSGVRPLARGDLEQVAALYEHLWRSRTRVPAPGLAPYFERVFLDGPGEALVHESGGRIHGFLGVQSRRFRFDGEPVTLACTGPLFTEPDARLVSALLVRAVFAGPQMLTITDGATPDAARLWERMGGHVHASAAVRWTRILRPWRLVSGHLARRSAIWRPCDMLAKPLLAVADAATRRLRGVPRLPEPAPRAEVLDAARLAEGHRALAEHYRLHPDYDVGTCEWLLREAAFATDRGALTGRLLRDADGQVLGWYLFYAPAGGIARVAQVAALPRAYGTVLAHLFATADKMGALAVQGRLEPRLVGPLREMRVALHFDASQSLVHTRDPGVQDALLAGDALVSRLDGEWCFSFQGLPLDK